MILRLEPAAFWKSLAQLAMLELSSRLAPTIVQPWQCRRAAR